MVILVPFILALALALALAVAVGGGGGGGGGGLWFRLVATFTSSGFLVARFVFACHCFFFLFFLWGGGEGALSNDFFLVLRNRLQKWLFL